MVGPAFRPNVGIKLAMVMFNQPITIVVRSALNGGPELHRSYAACGPLGGTDAGLGDTQQVDI